MEPQFDQHSHQCDAYSSCSKTCSNCLPLTVCTSVAKGRFMTAFVTFPGRMMILRHFWEQIHTGNKFETEMNEHSFRLKHCFVRVHDLEKLHCRSSLSKKLLQFASEPVEAAAIFPKVVVWSKGLPLKESEEFAPNKKTSCPYQILGVSLGIQVHRN